MKTLALLVGVVLLAIGIAGFVPALQPMLMGLPMDPVRAAIFAVTGIIGIMVGLSHRRTLPPTSTSGGRDLRGWM